MSLKMWDRVHRLKIAIPPDVSKDDVDSQFEKITGQDCDVAADALNEHDFRIAMNRALEQLRKKKAKERRVEVAV